MGCSNNVKNCPCTAGCSKKGNCCDCVDYHATKGEFPACFFTKEGERKMDRSLKCLLEDRGIKI